MNKVPWKQQDAETNKTRLFLALRILLWNCFGPPWGEFEGNLEGFLGDGSSLKILFSLQPLYLCLPVLLHSRYTGSKASAGVFLIAFVASPSLLYYHTP